MQLGIVTQMLGFLFNAVPSEMVRKSLLACLDRLESEVTSSPNKIDDMVIPAVDFCRRVLNSGK